MTTQAILSSIRMTCVTFQLAGAGGILPIYLSEEKEEKEEEWGGHSANKQTTTSSLQ